MEMIKLKTEMRDPCVQVHVLDGKQVHPLLWRTRQESCHHGYESRWWDFSVWQVVSNEMWWYNWRRLRLFEPFISSLDKSIRLWDLRSNHCQVNYYNISTTISEELIYFQMPIHVNSLYVWPICLQIHVYSFIPRVWWSLLVGRWQLSTPTVLSLPRASTPSLSNSTISGGHLKENTTLLLCNCYRLTGPLIRGPFLPLNFKLTVKK